MWVQHPRIGHLSVCLARKDGGKSLEADPDRVMIRARRREHLQNLKAAAPQLRRSAIREDNGADYRFRVICSKGTFADVMFDLAMSIDWVNVKDEARRNEDAVGGDFVHALHDVWSTFFRLQRDRD